MGLIAKHQHGKRTRYVAESPESLRTRANELKESIDDSMTFLSKEYASGSIRPTVSVLEGKNGLRHAIDDIVDSQNKGDTYYRYSSRKSTTSLHNVRNPSFKKNRDAKDLQRFVIASKERADNYIKDLNRQVKIISPKVDVFDDDIQMHIYADKISFFDFNTQTAVIIKNQKISRFQEKIFKLLYDLL